jgi:GT2 family glycosyltransferase
LVSIIVVNWNGLHLLEDCFSSLARQTWKQTEFILVDNGSTDGSRDLIVSWAERLPNAQTILLSYNSGFCKANNLAFAKARGEQIGLFSTDAVAEPDWLQELISAGDPSRWIGMLASKILFQEPQGVINKAGHLMYWDGQNRGRGTTQQDVGQYDKPEEILWPDACAALYHRKVFEETGGFDETFFAFGDDADLGLRARLLGWISSYVPTSVLHHRHSASFGADSPLKVMLVERNRLLLAIKHFHWPLLLQNPFWRMKRLWWNAYGVMRKKGAASRFVETNGWRQTLFNLCWSYLSAARLIPEAWRRRRIIQRTRRISGGEMRQLFEKFQIDVRELTLRE